MTLSVAFTTEVHAALTQHLVRFDRQEDLTFGLWLPSTGSTRLTAIVQQPILPLQGDRTVHGNAEYHPQYFERALEEALAAGSGIVFTHSHPGPGWQGLSDDDYDTERQLAPACLAATRLPLLGMTLGSDGTWSARLWSKTRPKTYLPTWCENVRVIGDGLRISFEPHVAPPRRFGPELNRTVSTWGPRLQSHLVGARVGVVGVGSVGSLVAEGIARLGVRDILLMDYDRIERVNLDRILHATRTAARLRTPKVSMIGRAIRKSATATKPNIRTSRWSVCEPAGFAEALDCDVLFSCVDRPWSRQVLNFIAYAHLIPVIDGGIHALARPGGDGVRRADWFVQTAIAGRACLECQGQYDPGLVAADREGRLDDPHYIEGLPNDHPGRRRENVFAFSMNVASFELLQYLALFVLPGPLSDPGTQSYHFVPSLFEATHPRCLAHCPYVALTGKGDKTGLAVTGPHKVAEERRGGIGKRLRV